MANKKTDNGNRRTLVQVVKDGAHRALMSDMSILGNGARGWKKLGKLQPGWSAASFAEAYQAQGWTLEEANDDDECPTRPIMNKQTRELLERLAGMTADGECPECGKAVNPDCEAHQPWEMPDNDSVILNDLINRARAILRAGE